MLQTPSTTPTPFSVWILLRLGCRRTLLASEHQVVYRFGSGRGKRLPNSRMSGRDYWEIFWIKTLSLAAWWVLRGYSKHPLIWNLRKIEVYFWQPFHLWGVRNWLCKTTCYIDWLLLQTFSFAWQNPGLAPFQRIRLVNDAIQACWIFFASGEANVDHHDTYKAPEFAIKVVKYITIKISYTCILPLPRSGPFCRICNYYYYSRKHTQVDRNSLKIKFR